MANYQQTQELPACLRPDDAGPDWCEPLNVRDLATRLETEGVTDAVAASEFGFDSTWSMAQAWMPRILEFRPRSAPLARRPSPWREYWKGISFALPLLCSSVSILLLGFSLWGGDLSAEDATAVGLGTVGSFLLTGGFVQVMSRRGLFYASTKQFRLCQESNWWWVRISLAAVLSAALAVLAASTYWDWLPGTLNLIAIAFCLALATFWLATGILHVLSRSLVIVWVTLAGIAMAAGLHFGLRWPLIVSQFAAILLASGAAFVLSTRVFRQRREISSGTLPSAHFRDAVFLWPYFVYGVLYYGLLFGDRIVAWTADTYASPFGVVFRGDYETALNIGLIAFVFEVGWVHQSTVGFYREMPQQLRRFSINQTSEFRRVMGAFYWSRILRFVPFAAAASALSLVAATQLPWGESVAAITACSLAGFPFLVIGLWNARLLFGLSSADKAAVAATWACLADLSAGYILTRVGTYHYAVVGFTLGAIVFAVLSGAYSLRAFRRLDYLYFAASV